MIPFYPKLGSQEDAPQYGPAPSDDKCENCEHYRDLGNQGFCEKFSFTCRPDFVCDDFRPSGVVKESSSVEEIKKVPKKKVHAVKNTAAALAEMKIDKALTEARKELVPSRYDRAIEGLKMVYNKTASTRQATVSSVPEGARSFVAGLDPLAGEVAREAIRDRLNEEVSAEEMIRRKRLASLGGAIGGGLLAPAGTALALGGAKGALVGRGIGRVSGAATGAGRAIKGTFTRAGAPALAAGGVLGAAGARDQYDLGTGLAELASEKSASASKRLQKIANRRTVRQRLGDWWRGSPPPTT